MKKGKDLSVDIISIFTSAIGQFWWLFATLLLLPSFKTPLINDAVGEVITSKKDPNADNEFWGCSAFPKYRAIAPVES